MLVIDVLTTWGDEYYVGLNGIDIFDDEGSLIWAKHRVSAVVGNPSDINILPDYDNDPRKVTNLLNGNNFTRDDLHVWLAPVGYRRQDKSGEGEQARGNDALATVTITFTESLSISMIRVFNYNKSRTHTQRGVRLCRMTLDGRVIFQGLVDVYPLSYFLSTY
jgi:hypothetical protein